MLSSIVCEDRGLSRSLTTAAGEAQNADKTPRQKESADAAKTARARTRARRNQWITGKHGVVQNLC